jgi:hypothetical protein
MSDYYPSIVDYGPLFSAARMEYRDPKVLARNSDPPTSHAAAKINRTGKKWKVLEALRLGPAGQTEIAARCGLLTHDVGKRLNDLRNDGLAMHTGREVRNDGGLNENEWRATDGR